MTDPKNADVDVGPADTGRRLPDGEALRARLDELLVKAKRGGADSAEASLSASRALSVSVRARARESVEYEGDRAATVVVYRGQRSGTASTTDLSPEGLAATLDQALTFARFTEPDTYAGLAEAEDMAGDWPALSLYHPWALTPEAAERTALEIEAAALDHDARIPQSEGATVASQDAVAAYANSHGFNVAEFASRHAFSCTAIAREGDGMQREIAFSQARDAGDLEAPAAIGRRAGERALARLGARTPPTATVPVLFTPRVARSLWSHLLSAISGGPLYRSASYLKDRIDTPVAAAGLTLVQRPHRPKGLSSTGFDSDGVATRDRTLVDAGMLRGYVLGAYSARRLGLRTTGNAGGVFNPEVAPGTASFDELVAGMGRGLIVTELMGQGVNLVNGDYSRGAAGAWVENGEIVYPVENATIAGNLDELYGAIEALGNDTDTGSALWTPSVLIGAMMVAGQ